MGALCLALLVLLPGCASVATHRVGPGFSGPTPQRYANSLDSATNGCLRNPAACYAPPGEEAILPWLGRALNALRTAAATLRLLEGAQVQHVEQVLFLCAKDAARALECVRKQMEALFPEHVRDEPLYQKDSATGLWRWVDPRQVAQWLSDGLFHLLRGSLVPDVVIHAAGNPNKVQRIYDLKFPCPAEKFGSWSSYHWGHPHHPRDQRQLYAELGGEEQPVIIHPIYGIQ
ncbi:hypothetical protein [Archangium sp.]|uniref:hypothetical protein n=1 Tax=Archangium sp. TaxID=1872627 RepID=UPI002D52B87F|nr:hypothetical protein [Archangium sp.]HYO52879.1 hypothetical protein [Archangium sp.]